MNKKYHSIRTFKVGALLIASGLLAGCTNDNVTTYIGDWHTHVGKCRNNGRVSMDLNTETNRFTFSMFCWMEECKTFTGEYKLNAYFQFDNSKGEHLEAAMSKGNVIGSWHLNDFEGHRCSGSFKLREKKD